MGTSVIVRPATEGDEEVVFKLFVEVQDHHIALDPDTFRTEPRDQEMRTFLHELIAERKLDVLVAETGNVVCGFAAIGIRESPAIPILEPRRWAHLDMIGVDAKFRGQGIGTALLSGVDDWARERGLDVVEMSVWEVNADALRLYERYGFTTTRRTLARTLSGPSK